jgi:hypothetical protein
MLLPATAWAQADSGNIAGVVRDTSGAVMPGVTVEAASPALIEKVRSVITDSQGLYRIVDLRPGTYTVTFALPGFSTVKREGISLTTGFTANVNAELKVGALEETVTVTGESPIVDTQNVEQQQRLSRETLDAIPTSRRPAQFITLILGADGGANASTLHDVGGVGSDRAFFGVHGQRADDMTYNFGGMDSRVFSGGGFQYNAHTFQEVVVETAAGSAEASTGGVQINIIPRDGGNIFSGTVSTEITGPKLQSDNINDYLRSHGIASAGAVRRYYDIGGGMGGPIKQNKLWFFTAARYEDRSLYQAGNYYNKRQGTVFYEPDLSRPAYNHDYSKDLSLRLTWQATTKHKLVGSFTEHPACQCTFALLEQVSPIFAPEAVAEHRYVPQYLGTAHYQAPLTERLLVEADYSKSRYNREQRRIPGVGRDAISVTDTGLNLRYGSRSTLYQRLNDLRSHERFAVSYVTGTHNFKAGLDMNQYSQGEKQYDDPFLVNHAISYTFRNQLPVSVSIYTGPYGPYQEGIENDVYVQDQWTIKRLTLNLGIRYGVYDMTIPAMHLGPGVYVPARDFPEVKHSPRWENLSPRVGMAYDLFGDGKTAIKWGLGRYPQRNTGVAVNLPVSNQPTSTTIAWNDTLFGPGDPRSSNFVPDCDLHNPIANGECGAWGDRTFGQVVGGNTRFADDALKGFNLENYNWQANISIQRQLRPNVGINVDYFRTWYGAMQALDNQLVTSADYDPFCITAPTDSRLGGASGKQFCGIYDVKPAKFGQFDYIRTQADHYGKMTEVFDGFDINTVARLGKAQFQGGWGIGRTTTDNCDLKIDSPSTATAGSPAGAALNLGVVDTRPGFCRVSRPWFSGGTQVKFNIVYALPWDFQASSIYQNIPGVPIRAQYVATDAEIQPSLGRHLASCPSQTAATCNQTYTVDLIPPFSLYGDRIQQVDLRLTRNFRLTGTRKIQGNFDIYNILNASTAQNEQANYRTGAANQWRNPIQIMGGRLIKFSAQLTF